MHMGDAYSMTSTTYSVTTIRGHVVTRVSDDRYVAASEKAHGRADGVRFHMTHDAARRTAGQFGRVHTFQKDAPVAAPTTDTWRVTFADGATRDYDVSIPPDAFKAAQADRPGVRATGASRVKD